MTVLFLPKVLSLVDLAFDPARRRAFGGLIRATISAIGETLFSTLHAPLQILFHTKFVVATLSGATVHWTAQKRGADGTAWSTAAREHAGHTALGLGWGMFAWWLDREAFWWFTPVLAGMVFSIPVSVFTSRARLGEALRRAGFFLTPQETSPPRELVRLEEKLADPRNAPNPKEPHYGLREAVMDPYVNAIHITLLRGEQANPHTAEGFAANGTGSDRIRGLAERLLLEGPDGLTPTEHLLVLSDPEVVLWLHREVWRRPPKLLANWWNTESRVAQS
jgi:membrane glycosyltransferase